ncbi:MAG: hypothetical protein ACYS8X_09790 [Planctomycetota bacterium]|jgi:UDP-N-acetylglucosamine acyltransferase
MPTISRYATVESTKLADDVVVGAFTYIGPDVRIGSGTIVESNVVITGRTTLGKDNHVFPGTVIGESPDSSARGKVKIGQANSIREHVIIQAGSTTTRIGNDCLIMIASRIGPDVTVGDHVVLANHNTLAAGAVLQDYTRSSAFAHVHANVTVGAYSFINSYAQIDHNAPPFATLDGDPFRVRGINRHLLTRCGFNDDDMRELKLAYREFYNGDRRQPDPAVMDRMLADSRLNPHVRRAIETLTRQNES